MDWLAGALALLAFITFIVRELCVKKTPWPKLLLQGVVGAVAMGVGLILTMMVAGQAFVQVRKISPPSDVNAGENEWMLYGLLLSAASSVVLGVWGARKIK